MNILGISCHYHDAAAAILIDGQIVAAAEEERFSRKKHDHRFPESAIDFCLRQAGTNKSEIDYVVFYEKPLLKFERILMTSLDTFPRSLNSFSGAMISWFGEKLWIKSQLIKHFSLPTERILFVDHHTAHAASAFFCSPFKESAIITIDGVGEWTTAATGSAVSDWDGTSQNGIDLRQEIVFPHSLGLLYSAFTAFLGFEVNEGEYKVMGMAPYGSPRYLDLVHNLVTVANDGSFQLNMDYFCYQYSTRRTFNEKFVRLFGEPRDPRSEFITHQTHPEFSGANEIIQLNQHYADVAASIQLVTEDIIVRMAQNLQRQTGLDNLCFAGGVALNGLANSRILRETGFKDLFIQPAAGDSGGAVGAALYVWHVLLGKPRKFILENAYLGSEYKTSDICDMLSRRGISYETIEDDSALCNRLAEELLAGKVLGWFQGRFEWGPRALGNRSILADPRKANMKDLVNRKIKFRELFRPFAPVILEEHACDYFQTSVDLTRCYPARFMTLILPWKDRVADLVPAVNHCGTGRLQTLRREWNPRYYQLIKRFQDGCGIPVLLNTSFNLRGEPIVASPLDALNTFMKSELDILVLNQHIIRREHL